MNANSQAVIDNLKKYGASEETIKFLTRDLENSKAIDNYFDKRIMKTSEFTNYRTQAEAKIQELQKNVQELASSHDLAKTGTLDETTQKVLTERIALLEEFLIDEGYPDDEVRNLSYREGKGLTESERQKNLETQKKIQEANQNGKGEGEEMTFDEKKFVNVDQYSTDLANIAGGSVNMSLMGIGHIRRYERLYGEKVDDAKIASFGPALIDGLNKGKSHEQIAEEHFQYSTREKELQEETVQQRIKSETDRLVAEKLKEVGYQAPVRNKYQRPIGSALDLRDKRLKSRQTQTPANSNSGQGTGQGSGNGETVEYMGKEIPVNKDGIPEYWRARRTREDRVEDATAFFDEVVEKVGVDGARMGFLE